MSELRVIIGDEAPLAMGLLLQVGLRVGEPIPCYEADGTLVAHGELAIDGEQLCVRVIALT